MTGAAAAGFFAQGLEAEDMRDAVVMGVFQSPFRNVITASGSMPAGRRRFLSIPLGLLMKIITA